MCKIGIETMSLAYIQQWSWMLLPRAGLFLTPWTNLTKTNQTGNKSHIKAMFCVCDMLNFANSVESIRA